MKIHTDPNCTCHMCHPENYSFGESKLSYLHCNECGKQVSSGFVPAVIEGFEGLVVRAWIECPECIEKRNEALHQVRS